MEKQLLFVKNSRTVLAVPVIDEVGKCKIFISEHGRPTLWYQADEDGGYYSSKEVAKRIPNDQKNELSNALSLIKKHYNPATKSNAIEDFYPRIKSIVRRLYKGDYVLFAWLKNRDESHIVATHADLFRRTATELKSEGKTLNTDKFDMNNAEEILAILS
jgi:predicted site-specific integrase-resolvase